jgi:hypothetical protein
MSPAKGIKPMSPALSRVMFCWSSGLTIPSSLSPWAA